jgi:hypothetical protein
VWWAGIPAVVSNKYCDNNFSEISSRKPNNFFQYYIFVTVEGERVLGCIRNGLVLAGGGTFLLNLPPLLIIPILQALSEPTGCGGVIEWSYIGNVGDLRDVKDRLT